MRRADVYNFGVFAGELIERERGGSYVFRYADDYNGPPVSLTLPLSVREYEFDRFPPFFEGLLPEGVQLEALLRKSKIDQDDYFSILLVTGKDLVGSVTVGEGE